MSGLQRGLDLRKRHANCPLRDCVEVLLRALQMQCALHMVHGLTRLESRGRRGGLELVERAQWGLARLKGITTVVCGDGLNMPSIQIEGNPVSGVQAFLPLFVRRLSVS